MVPILLLFTRLWEQNNDTHSDNDLGQSTTAPRVCQGQSSCPDQASGLGTTQPWPEGGRTWQPKGSGDRLLHYSGSGDNDSTGINSWAPTLGHTQFKTPAPWFEGSHIYFKASRLRPSPIIPWMRPGSLRPSPTCPPSCLGEQVTELMSISCLPTSRRFIQTQLLSKTPPVCAPPPPKGSLSLSLSLSHDLNSQPLITNDPDKGHSPSIGKARTTEQGVLDYNAICTEVWEQVTKILEDKQNSFFVMFRSLLHKKFGNRSFKV